MNNNIPEELRKAYSVGALIYMPAMRNDICEKICSFGGDHPLSVALCLEDTINDNAVLQAENNLITQLCLLHETCRDISALPMIFVRVRNEHQIEMLTERLGKASELLTGIILPKIDDEEIDRYIPSIKKYDRYLYMPIIENPSLIRKSTRYQKLEALDKKLSEVSDRILNVRVGGNDFCKNLALRCGIDSTVYDLLPVAELLSDICIQFSDHYVVSAPVWNYFDNNTDDKWKNGLINEICKDKNVGFIGKTVIHPSQIPVVTENMKVTRSEYDDASKLGMTMDNTIQIIKGENGNSMLEHKVHLHWAEKILILADIYGIKD